MTRVVGVMNSKGGCGKTTVATHLAVAFAGSGLASGLADLDRQKSAMGWARIRPKTVAKVEILNWTRHVAKRCRGLQRLVLDTSAAVTPRDAAAIISLCDAVIVPILPSVFDEMSTARFLRRIQKIKLLRKGRVAVHIVGNRYRPASPSAARLNDFLTAIDQPLTATVPDLTIYGELAAHGMTLFDFKTKSAQRLQEDWIPLVERIEVDFAEREFRRSPV